MSVSDVSKSFKAGDTVMKQGEQGDCAYIIEKGRVEIFIEQDNGRNQSIGTRGVGTMIGEMALVDRAPRTATIKAIEDCEFLVISEDDFTRRLNKADPILRMTTHIILQRYRDTLLRAQISGENKSWPPSESLELSYEGATSAVERVKLANELKAALNNGHLHLHYQPIIDLSTGATAGFEALMRWTHPEKGPISPGLFIPAAEETGLINELSPWALEEACAALKRIERNSGVEDGKLFMSVNFSASDFGIDGFIDDLYNTVSETDIRPQQLHIEITERVLMTQPEKAKKTLRMCADAGMHISIDDFGTGYSSLSYLHHFPINTLKVDRSFVSEMLKDQSSMTLVKSIINLGKNMGMEIIAEGAEVAEEVQALKELGCDMVQGYFFAKPMTEKEVTTFIKQPAAAKAKA